MDAWRRARLGAVKLVMFCEADADFRLASGLFDRVHCEHGPDWVAAAAETPEATRTWHASPEGRDYFSLRKLNDYAAHFRVRAQRGHFEGKPGAVNAAMARKAFDIAGALHKIAASDAPLEAVVLIGDADQAPDERRQGFVQAKASAKHHPFAIACGLPDPAREAWILAGFEPDNDDEREALRSLHAELQLSPQRDAVKLRDKQPGALRDIKRVATRLTNGDHDREARCWKDPSLDVLRKHGAETGLAAFLDELRDVVAHLHRPTTR